MADKDLILREKLEYKGIFDFAAFYSFSNSWFADEQYIVTEERYIENITSGGRDIAIEWKATKKISDYFKIEQSIKMEIKGMADVEVEIDGKKKKSNKGKISLDLKASLVKDTDSRWESTPFQKFLRGIYDKYIIPARIDSMEQKTAGDCRAFKEDSKAFFELMGRK